MGFYLLSTAVLYLSLGLALGRWLLHAPSTALAAPPADQLAAEVLIPAAPAPLEAALLPAATERDSPAAEQSTTNNEPPPAAEPAEAPLAAALTEERLISSSTFAASDLPAAWLALLPKECTGKSFVEASAQVLRLEVGRYRDELVRLDTRVRERLHTDEKRIAAAREELAAAVNSAAAKPVVAADGVEPTLAGFLDEIQTELEKLNAEWVARQAEATKVLTAQGDDTEELADLRHNLEYVLFGQMAQIETTAMNLKLARDPRDALANARRLLHEFGKLLALAHQLRDQMLETLTAVMLHEQRLQTWNQDDLRDPLTKLHNRAGWELHLKEWWQENPNRIRTFSSVLLDLDRFTQLNDQWGAQVGDQVLASFGPLLQDLLRKNRGLDLAIRVAGQQFLLFLADTGPRGANPAAERIRQTVAEIKFAHPRGEFGATVTAAVTDSRLDDTAATIWKRLQATLHAARREGRNLVMLDEGAGPTGIEAPAYEVPVYTTKLAKAAAAAEFAGIETAAG